MKENVGENAANVYIIDTEEQKMAVWGSTVLDGKMDEVVKGNKIRITYLGKEKNYHNYKLEVDQ